MDNKMLLGTVLLSCFAVALFYMHRQSCSWSSIKESTHMSYEAQPIGNQTHVSIEHIKWGEITVDDNGKRIVYQGDAKLWPHGSKKWDWGKTGTHHNPGIQIADIQELMDKTDIIILTRGMDLVLQVPQETIDYAKKLGKQVYVGQTEQMVSTYNELVKAGKKVAGVFHSTC